MLIKNIFLIFACAIATSLVHAVELDGNYSGQVNDEVCNVFIETHDDGRVSVQIETMQGRLESTFAMEQLSRGVRILSSGVSPQFSMLDRGNIMTMKGGHSLTIKSDETGELSSISMMKNSRSLTGSHQIEILKCENLALNY